MTEAPFARVGDTLVPTSEYAWDVMKKLSQGEVGWLKLRRMRNPGFHRKMFALFKFGFDHWEPKAGRIAIEKNFDRFRKDITILAGFYEQTFRVNGEIRTEAKSIAYDKMDETEFEELFNKVVDVLIKYILPKTYTGDELRAVIGQVEAFEE